MCVGGVCARGRCVCVGGGWGGGTRTAQQHLQAPNPPLLYFHVACHSDAHAPACGALLCKWRNTKYTPLNSRLYPLQAREEAEQRAHTQVEALALQLVGPSSSELAHLVEDASRCACGPAGLFAFRWRFF